MADTVIFDLDGTLLNSLPDLAQAVNFVRKKHNLPPHTINQVKSNIGDGVEKLLERSNILEYLDEFKEYYSNHMMENTKPYDGIIEMLKELHKKYKIGVVSNKYDSAVKELCKKYFNDLVDIAIGQTETTNKKPAPDTVFIALRELKSKSAVFVGDSDVDIKTAKNANLDCISVSWGYRPIEELKLLNDKIISYPSEIFSYLDKY